MHVVCVHVQVKAEAVEAFIAITRENARATRGEPGNLRFDVLQQKDDPARFMLYEVYRQESDLAKHKETEHYAAWRTAAGPMMACDRIGIAHSPLFPEGAEAWRAGE